MLTVKGEIKMSSRTDLALEMVDRESIADGITRTTRGNAFTITEILIDSDKCGETIGKGKGRYVTLEGDRLSHLSDNYRDMVYELAEELRGFIRGRENIMVVGLGNDDITPDALGPYSAAGVMATRHLRREMPDDEFLSGLREVSVLLSGVLGTTGIESAEIVKAVADSTKPDMIIVIDALACSELSRLGKTIQISDAGIAPGSGVENKRKELSERTLGIPVIAIGVPTIVDVHTVIENITGKEPDRDMPNMMVTPKNIDSLITHASRLIATGLNLALQPSLDFEDAAEMAAG